MAGREPCNATDRRHRSRNEAEVQAVENRLGGDRRGAGTDWKGDGARRERGMGGFGLVVETLDPELIDRDGQLSTPTIPQRHSETAVESTQVVDAFSKVKSQD